MAETEDLAAVCCPPSSAFDASSAQRFLQLGEWNKTGVAVTWVNILMQGELYGSPPVNFFVFFETSLRMKTCRR